MADTGAPRQPDGIFCAQCVDWVKVPEILLDRSPPKKTPPSWSNHFSTVHDQHDANVVRREWKSAVRLYRYGYVQLYSCLLHFPLFHAGSPLYYSSNNT